MKDKIGGLLQLSRFYLYILLVPSVKNYFLQFSNLRNPRKIWINTIREI